MNKIRFMHIPKAGGSTLGQAIADQLKLNSKQALLIGPRTDLIGPQADVGVVLKQWEAIPSNERSQIQFLSGHVPLVTGIPDIDKLPVITMLREPVSRYQSLCQHACEGKSPYLLEHFSQGDEFDLDTFLDSSLELGFDNTQTKFLVNESGEYLSSDRIRAFASEEEAAETAVNILFDKTTFGLTEYYDESLEFFSSVLQFKLQPPELIYNPAYYKIYPSHKCLTYNEAQLEKIRQLNTIDIMVYQAAKQKFLAKLNAAKSLRNFMRSQ